MAGSGPTIQIPRWIQLVGLPVLLVLAWMLAQVLGPALFLFLAAAVIAFLLNPLVRDLEGIRVRRGFGVVVVYFVFLGAVIAAVLAIATVVADQTDSAANRADDYLTEKGSEGLTGAELDVDRLQVWLDSHGLERIQVREQLQSWLDSLSAGEISDYTRNAISFAEGAARSVVILLFSIILIVVISIYMLLDMPRLEARIDRRFPPHDGQKPLTRSIESALVGYVKGQLILSTVIGASAGIGMWILGSTGLVEGAERYALLFALWTAVIEVIPYIGPWLSAIPPLTYALVVDPVSALWVIGLFVFIYQVEGHIVVPNVMASALRLHPLLVIFGLLAGGELYGLPGVLLALPTMAAGRAIWEFFAPRIELESWESDGHVPVEVEIEPLGHPPPGPTDVEPPRAVSGS